MRSAPTPAASSPTACPPTPAALTPANGPPSPPGAPPRLALPATEAARLALRAYKCHRAENGGRGQREAPPITIDALRAMVAACDLTTPIGLRDRLLLVLGLALMGRRSELVALNREDVREVADGLEVRDLAVRAGVPSADTITAHSLRAGGATVAYAAGVPIAIIAKHGR
ncbi:hypothetical protein [Nonomuraea angiospora]